MAVGLFANGAGVAGTTKSGQRRRHGQLGFGPVLDRRGEALLFGDDLFKFVNPARTLPRCRSGAQRRSLCRFAPDGQPQ